MKNLTIKEAVGIGFFLGTVITILFIWFINPNANQPCIPDVDTVYVDTVKIKATYYNPVKEQTDNSPLITSDGTTLNKNSKSIAVSRDLLKSHPYGSKIFIIEPKNIAGIYTVNDCLNRRYKQQIDIMVWKGKINVDSIIFIKV
jgi:3D (Asp-Asp-Asp) domain-containing protein